MTAAVAKRRRCAEGPCVKTMLGARATKDQAGIVGNERLVVVRFLCIENLANGFRVWNIRGDREHPTICRDRVSYIGNWKIVAICNGCTMTTRSANEEQCVGINRASEQQVSSPAEVTRTVLHNIHSRSPNMVIYDSLPDKLPLVRMVMGF